MNTIKLLPLNQDSTHQTVVPDYLVPCLPARILLVTVKLELLNRINIPTRTVMVLNNVYEGGSRSLNCDRGQL